MSKPQRRRATNRFVDPRAHHRERLGAAGQGALMTLPLSSFGSFRDRSAKLLAVVLTIVMLVVMIAYFNIDGFYIYAPELHGLNLLTSAEVIKASGVIGYNVFFVEPRRVEQAVATIPEVRSVHVLSSVPNRLVIAIQEREPKLKWQRGSEFFWVDEDSVVMQVRSNQADLPVLRDLDQSPIKVGEKTPAQATAAVLAIRRNWGNSPRLLEWTNARGLSFSDEHGWKVYLGDSSDMAGKMAKYWAVAAMLSSQQTQIKFIDLGKGDPFYQ